MRNNLLAAERILSDRTRYDREGADVVRWAEQVIARLKSEQRTLKGEST